MQTRWRKEKEWEKTKTKIIGVAGLLYFLLVVLLANHFGIVLN